MKTIGTLLTIVLFLFGYSSYAQNKEHKEYYDSGKLKFVGYMTPDEKLVGEWKSYYESGKLMGISIFKNDKLEGDVKAYYESGKLRAIEPYRNDLLHGEAKIYYESGGLKMVENFVDGELTGEIIYYYKNGQPDNRRKELKAALQANLVKDESIVSVSQIVVGIREIDIYYLDDSELSEKMVKVPMNLHSIDQEGVMTFRAHKDDVDTFQKTRELKFDGDKVEYFFKKNGDYRSYFVSGSLDVGFKVKKEGINKIMQLMKGISEDLEN